MLEADQIGWWAGSGRGRREGSSTQQLGRTEGEGERQGKEEGTRRETSPLVVCFSLPARSVADSLVLPGAGGGLVEWWGAWWACGWLVLVGVEPAASPAFVLLRVSRRVVWGGGGPSGWGCGGAVRQLC